MQSVARKQVCSPSRFSTLYSQLVSIGTLIPLHGRHLQCTITSIKECFCKTGSWPVQQHEEYIAVVCTSPRNYQAMVIPKLITSLTFLFIFLQIQMWTSHRLFNRSRSFNVISALRSNLVSPLRLIVHRQTLDTHRYSRLLSSAFHLHTRWIRIYINIHNIIRPLDDELVSYRENL